MSKYGWTRQLPDQRDYSFSVPEAGAIALPASIDPRKSIYEPPILNQGQLSSCTANAIASAFEHDLRRQKFPDFAPSRLFIYYGERDLEGSITSDAGASIRDGFKVISNLGVCSETDWPYNITKFAVKPTSKCYMNALKNKAIRYQAVAQSSYAIRYAIYRGYYVVGGFSLYESFETQAVAETGIVPMPSVGEVQLGGHAVAVEGYKLIKSTLYAICRNSWGLWGDKGYFYLPMEYLTNPSLAADFWVVETVS